MEGLCWARSHALALRCLLALLTDRLLTADGVVMGPAVEGAVCFSAPQEL